MCIDILILIISLIFELLAIGTTDIFRIFGYLSFEIYLVITYEWLISKYYTQISFCIKL